jgi:hypothetical protein
MFPKENQQLTPNMGQQKPAKRGNPLLLHYLCKIITVIYRYNTKIYPL